MPAFSNENVEIKKKLRRKQKRSKKPKLELKFGKCLNRHTDKISVLIRHRLCIIKGYNHSDSQVRNQNIKPQ